jgi:hypothetical protein
MGFPDRDQESARLEPCGNLLRERLKSIDPDQPIGWRMFCPPMTWR